MITAHMNIRKKDFVQEPKLLAHPNIPHELSGVAPRVILGDLWWEKTKEQVKRSTDFHCKACGRHRSEDAFHNWIECHEVYWFDYKNNVAKFERVVPLCHTCHSFIHSGRLIALYEEDEEVVTYKKVQTVLEHGFALCAQFGVRPFYTTVEAALFIDMFKGDEKIPATWNPDVSRSKKRWKLDIFGTLFTLEDVRR